MSLSAENFYKSNPDCPLPHADGTIAISEDDMFNVMEAFFKAKIKYNSFRCSRDEEDGMHQCGEQCDYCKENLPTVIEVHES